MSISQSILLLVLGWLFGLLSPVIVDAIRRRRQTAQIKSAIIVELTEVRLKLALNAFNMAMRFGASDKAMYEWIKSFLEIYSGPSADPQIIKAANEMLSQPDNMSIIASHFRAFSNKSPSLRRYYTPVLDSQVAKFAIFSQGIQNFLIEIRMQLGYLNEIVDQAQFFYQKGFDSSLSDENSTIIKNNLNETYQKFGEKSRSVADLITKCKNSWS